MRANKVFISENVYREMEKWADIPLDSHLLPGEWIPLMTYSLQVTWYHYIVL